jgi:hypothetical protein
MMMIDTTTTKRADSMTMSRILFVFQSTYVLRTKKHSEQAIEVRLNNVVIFINVRHLLLSSFGTMARYRFAVIIERGTYRAMT